jgi:hypothetical protein
VPGRPLLRMPLGQAVMLGGCSPPSGNLNWLLHISVFGMGLHARGLSPHQPSVLPPSPAHTGPSMGSGAAY